MSGHSWGTRSICSPAARCGSTHTAPFLDEDKVPLGCLIMQARAIKCETLADCESALISEYLCEAGPFLDRTISPDRHLALVRMLCVAHAKLSLRSRVHVRDVQQAVAIHWEYTVRRHAMMAQFDVDAAGVQRGLLDPTAVVRAPTKRGRSGAGGLGKKATVRSFLTVLRREQEKAGVVSSESAKMLWESFSRSASCGTSVSFEEVLAQLRHEAVVITTPQGWRVTGALL